MPLTNIEYGALASSEVMNNNFEYLDNKISEKVEAITNSVSTLNSNIATINSSLAEISDKVNSTLSETSAKLDEYKTKTKMLVTRANLVPDWSARLSINLQEGTYTAPINGYILMQAQSLTSANVNDLVLTVEGTMCLPLKEGDVVRFQDLVSAYFIPQVAVSVANF